MSDLISRKAVQKYIEKIRQVAQMMDDIIRRESIVMNGMDLCEEAVRNQPSAQSERKKGKWIEYDNSHCECPFCHTEWSYFDNDVEHFDFCPRCGAKMEAET
jgi:Zn finger protein HypA/HybF involved in hydrogenase expression